MVQYKYEQDTRTNTEVQNKASNVLEKLSTQSTREKQRERREKIRIKGNKDTGELIGDCPILLNTSLFCVSKP